ncbi:putative bifunctional diguanylate cyclase/phosphodiesterase [Guyparkeria sp.]|uniref:putative bifunctional diguanylate cyclase/phosphodiesterase n=1 Tax=Guyparkeria sp. TaxID=2035736 RepID=UPI003970FAE2
MAPTDQQPIKVLVVEDDIPTRMLIRGILRKNGYAFLEADNGREGVEAFTRHVPDLVLMDVMMPEMNGFEACQAIRKLESVPGTPIIMLTSADATSDITEAFDSGATDFITKPINLPLLTARLRYAWRARCDSAALQRARLQQINAQKIARLGFWDWRVDSGHIEWSESLEALTGIAAEHMDTPEKLCSRTRGEDTRRLRDAFQVAENNGTRFDIEIRLAIQGDNPLVLHLVAEPDSDPSGALVYQGAFKDLTAIRQTETLVQHVKLHDQLTSLPNRKMLLHQLYAEIDRGARGVGLVVLDINRFGRLNDALGIQAGDQILKIVAGRMKQVLPREVEIARLDGDQFALTFPHNDLKRIRGSTEVFLAEISRPSNVADQTVFLSMTGGIALAPQHAGNAEGLVQAAQEAQQSARRTGEPLAVAESTPDDQATRILKLEFALREAVQAGFAQFHLVYQPQMLLADNAVIGVEALIRWEHPDLGLIPPPQFIPMLEEMGLISELGDWILREACQQQRAWREQEIRVLMGVNLSPRQFQDARLPEILDSAISAAGISPEHLKLEITESTAMQDPKGTIAQLHQWREQGFKIAIDDFGIGYSSLEYLLRFPLDTVKIDRAFVKKIVHEPSDRAIVRAITVMAQSMGLETIAEGVETQRQQDYLDAIGVDQIQGYLLGRPMKHEEFARFYRQHDPRTIGASDPA